MADFRQVHSVNPALPFDVEHYESRLKASNFDGSLELLAALASIISLEGPKLEPPKLGYFSTFRVSIPKNTRRTSKKNSPKKGCDDHSKQSRALSRVSTLKAIQTLSSIKLKAKNVRVLYGIGQQGLNREQQYRSSLVKHGVYPIQLSHKKYKCVICSELFEKELLVWRHGAIHLKRKPFECENCPRKFDRVDSLQRHLKHCH